MTRESSTDGPQQAGELEISIHQRGGSGNRTQWGWGVHRKDGVPVKRGTVIGTHAKALTAALRAEQDYLIKANEKARGHNE